MAKLLVIIVSNVVFNLVDGHEILHEFGGADVLCVAVAADALAVIGASVHEEMRVLESSEDVVAAGLE